jgi:hypothetical protein
MRHPADPPSPGEHLYQPTTKAGDVVLWSEATVHGATPWRAPHERRIALYRFAPANMGYGRGYLSHPPEVSAACDSLACPPGTCKAPLRCSALWRPSLTRSQSTSDPIYLANQPPTPTPACFPQRAIL